MGVTTRVLFVFLDGVGIGQGDPEANPFFAARIPALTRLMGGRVPTLSDPHVRGSNRCAFPLQATLDVEGTPQSGTGQAALLTGHNAAEMYGRHFGPWTPVRLRPLVEQESVLKRAAESGLRAAFANAYPKWWPGPKGGKRVAGPPLAARGAGLLTRHEEALGAGDAVSSEIVNDGWREKLGHHQLPEISAAEAGVNLARIANGHDLTMFAHYSTDTAGHRGRMAGGIAAIERVDDFLSGVIDELGDDVLLLIASDHGNLEDVSAGHTTNPVLGVAMGPGAERAATMTDIRDVCTFILDAVGHG